LNTFSWQGACGRWHEFEVARVQRAWDPVGGVYMFVKPHDSVAQQWGGPIVLFLGTTDDFSVTLARHEMWQAAEHLGAKEIHLLAIKDAQTRARVEQNLLEAQAPILNQNMRKRVA
jgi:hypothetical protein